jgi:hypothetical protein
VITGQGPNEIMCRKDAWQIYRWFAMIPARDFKIINASNISNTTDHDISHAKGETWIITKSETEM